MSTTLSATQQTTTSAVLLKDLHTPFSGPTIKKVKGFLTKIDDAQQVAATGNQYHVVRTAGAVSRALVGIATLAAAGESMTIDIQKNGTSILTSPSLAVAHTTTPVGLFDVTALLIAGTSVVPGDVIKVVRTYTAGGGPTMTETDISLEIS